MFTNIGMTEETFEYKSYYIHSLLTWVYGSNSLYYLLNEFPIVIIVIRIQRWPTRILVLYPTGSPIG